MGILLLLLTIVALVISADSFQKYKECKYIREYYYSDDLEIDNKCVEYFYRFIVLGLFTIILSGIFIQNFS